jgi:hypothetical protein
MQRIAHANRSGEQRTRRCCESFPVAIGDAPWLINRAEERNPDQVRLGSESDLAECCDRVRYLRVIGPEAPCPIRSANGQELTCTRPILSDRKLM